jgi:hypothetical protein
VLDHRGFQDGVQDGGRALRPIEKHYLGGTGFAGRRDVERSFVTLNPIGRTKDFPFQLSGDRHSIGEMLHRADGQVSGER